MADDYKEALNVPSRRDRSRTYAWPCAESSEEPCILSLAWRESTVRGCWTHDRFRRFHTEKKPMWVVGEWAWGLMPSVSRCGRGSCEWVGVHTSGMYTCVSCFNQRPHGEMSRAHQPHCSLHRLMTSASWKPSKEKRVSRLCHPGKRVNAAKRIWPVPSL